MVLGNKFYPEYPKIRQKDLGTDTSNKFIDTLNISNLYLKGISGDYDGDQVTIKGIYTKEANKEIEDLLKSKSHYINLGGKGIRESSNEAIVCLYSLTMCLSDDINKMTKNIA